jgi:hypothetical protein
MWYVVYNSANNITSKKFDLRKTGSEGTMDLNQRLKKS